MDKRDEYIKAQMQQDKEISNKANEIFQNFERRIKMEENNKPKEKKVIKLSLQHAVLAFTSLMIVVVLGGNLYAHIKGKPNIYSAIKGLFVKEDKYTASEIVVDQTVESNGIKLTLKTVAMDENILITKYIAQGEKLANEFYAYQEFEQDVIKLVKINLKLAEWNIMKDDPEYKDVTSKDAVAQAQLISKRLSIANLTEGEEEALMKIAKKAYQEFIVLELSPENASEKKVNELIEETIAMFESKVNSKYDVMSVDTKLQEFGIQTISEKVEKSGNEYIIYNVYNVDTISDLASKFNLSVNVNKIGNIEGKWNFNTELEKARLDTRVETIEFYENNSCDNVAPTITVADGVRHSATVEAKKLVISDFSTVLMIQTKVLEKDREYYLEYAKDGLPCIFVVTDENGNILGTGTRSGNSYNSAMDIGESVIYTDRIILKNVNKDTKKIYVKIYEQYDMDGETIKINNEIIELDIEVARSNSEPVELNQSYTSKQHQVSFRYPGNWTITEEQDQIIIKGPEDIDGNSVEIYMMPDTEDSAHPGQNSKEIIEGLYNTYSGLGEECEKGEINIAGTTGYYFSHYVYGRVDGKSKRVCVERDEKQFTIDYSGILTQYERYEETFNKILETIEFLEPEKSYDVFGGNYCFVRVYEDNNLTIEFPTDDIFFDDLKANYGVNLEPNKEYTITGIEEKVLSVWIHTAFDDHIGIPHVLIKTEDFNLYYMKSIVEDGTFKAEKLLEGVQGNIEIADSDFAYYAPIVKTRDGKSYILTRDSERTIAEEYIEETEDTNQEQAQQPEDDEFVSGFISNEFNTAEYDSIKEWSDGQITIQFKEGVTSYKDAKDANIKTDGTSYRIYGIEGDIQNIYRIRNAQVEIYDALPAYVFETKNEENKTNIYLINLSNFNQYYFSANGPLVSDISEFLYIQDNGMDVITKDSKGYNIRYEGATYVGKVPTKQEIYNILEAYVTGLGKKGEEAPNLYDTKNYVNINFGKSNNSDCRIIISVNRKEYSQGQKEIWAAIEFDETEQEWKVVDFRLQARGGV